jgi:hypothetical protein
LSSDGAKYPPDFEACWKAYRHVKGRSSKPATLSAWRKLPADERSALLGAVERYAACGHEPNADCGAPAMERWLNKSRHLDWLNPDSGTTPAIVQRTTHERPHHDARFAAKQANTAVLERGAIQAARRYREQP